MLLYRVLQVDISFNMSSGVKSAELIKQFKVGLNHRLLLLGFTINMGNFFHKQSGVTGEIPSPVPPGDGPEAVPAAAGPERGVHRRHLLVLPYPDVHQLPAAAPAARAPATVAQPRRAAHRVLRALRQEVQLREDRHPRQERRLIRLQG